MRFILASISGKFRAKIRKILPRFARPMRFSLASISGRIQSENSKASASLRSGLRFIVASSPVNSEQKFEKLCLASLGQCDLVWLQPRRIQSKNSKASASLRSAMRLILALISGRIQSKNSKASASLRSAMRFILA